MCKCAQLEFHRIQTKKTFRALKIKYRHYTDVCKSCSDHCEIFIVIYQSKSADLLGESL